MERDFYIMAPTASMRKLMSAIAKASIAASGSVVVNSSRYVPVAQDERRYKVIEGRLQFSAIANNHTFAERLFRELPAAATEHTISIYEDEKRLRIHAQRPSRNRLLSLLEMREALQS
jgi:hypothetical protein